MRALLFYKVLGKNLFFVIKAFSLVKADNFSFCSRKADPLALAKK